MGEAIQQVPGTFQLFLKSTIHLLLLFQLTFRFDTIEIEISKPVSISGNQFILNPDSR